MPLLRPAAAALAVAAFLPAAAHATTFGADLSQTPIDQPSAVCSSLGENSCLAFPTVPSTYAPSSGTVTAVRVRTNSEPQGPMQIVVLRSYYRNNLASPGEPYFSCCFVQAYGPTFTPKPGAITTVPADLEMIEQPTPPSNDGTTVAAGDFLALSILSPSTQVPEAAAQNALTGYYAPAPSPANSYPAGLTGGRGSAFGYALLLNADLTPVDGSGGGGGGGGAGPPVPKVVPPLTLPTSATVAHDQAALALACKLTSTCRGTATLELPPGKAADVAKAKPKPPTVLGSARFAIKAGKRGTVKVALNRAGRRQLKAHRSVKATLLVKDGSKTVTRAVTLKR